MLKKLFTSSTRVKLLTVFLINPDGEFFIRELTRELDEQINSIRRELNNLKSIGLLKSKSKNRKKFFTVNKDFIIYNELRAIITKGISKREEIAKKISSMGNIQVLIMSGLFVNKESPIDLLLVGEINRDELEKYLETELETPRSLKFSVMTNEDFLYRQKCKDKFITDLLEDKSNLIPINKLKT